MLQHRTERDHNGNLVDVETDFEIKDYKHSCRTCKEMTDNTTVKVRPARTYNLQDLRGQKSKLVTMSSDKDLLEAKQLISGEQPRTQSTKFTRPQLLQFD